MNFIHLNVHSHFSKGWGMGTLEELCLSAKEQGMDTLALTDTNGLYGLIFFLQTAKETGIRPILGGEIETKARLTDRVGKGLVFMPFHFAESAANVLTNSALDPVAKIPEYKVCAVKVEKV